jgi:polyisoprenoid-binding protein YceI
MRKRIKQFILGMVVVGVASGASFVSAEEYTIDPTHSTIGFAVKHLMVSTTRGNFGQYEGKINYDAQKMDEFGADVTIQVASINTGVADRDNHLKAADFFDAEKFPTITFKAKKLSHGETGHEIIGDLTIKGITKEIVIPVEISGPVTSPYGVSVIGITGQTKINRQDFGVSWNKSLDAGGVVVDDHVTVIVELEAGKK